MATTRSRGTSLPLLSAMIFGILLCIFAAPAYASASQPSPSSSPDDLICVENAGTKDCYPRIFQPTDEFQAIREGQEIPSGLHVRMNINTGLREAKINVPDEMDPSLEGLPVDQAVVIVDPEPPETPQIPKDAPAYEAVGKIKEPRDAVREAASFVEGMKILQDPSKATKLELHDALEALEDISHDMYYGLKIIEDPEILKSLFCLLVRDDGADAHDWSPPEVLAAATLSGALQNNPTALDEVVKAWPHIMGGKCAYGPSTALGDLPHDASVKLGDFYYDSLNFLPLDKDLTPGEHALQAMRVKARVGAISGLIKDDTLRAEFLQRGGMRKLLQVLVPESKEYEAVQRKAGQVVLDTFLDEDMGAKPGQWPTTPKLSAEQCQGTEGVPEEGCWDYYVEKIMKANKWTRGHWSRDLHDRLAAARKMSKGYEQPRKHEEL